MNFEDQIQAQMHAMFLCSDDKLRWRPILMFAALRVSKPGKVLNAMQAVDPTVFQGRSMPAAITAVRRMLNEIRSQMGLPNLPVSETQKENPKKNRPGKPTDAQLDEYRKAHCLPWIQKNGGEPRPEQFADFNWDLKPYPPKSGLSSPPLDCSPPAAGKQNTEVQVAPVIRQQIKETLPNPEHPLSSYSPEQQAKLAALVIDEKGEISIPSDQPADQSPEAVQKRLASKKLKYP
jgi:hypothetical protein